MKLFQKKLQDKKTETTQSSICDGKRLSSQKSTVYKNIGVEHRRRILYVVDQSTVIILCAEKT